MPREPAIVATSPREVRQRLGLSREKMARLLDVSAKSVERWEEQGSAPASAFIRDRLATIDQIVRLGLTVYTPEGLRRFLTTPMGEFGGLTGVQLIEIGQSDRLLAALAADYEGLGG